VGNALLVIAVLTIVAWLVIIAAVLAARRRLRRRLDVAPGVASAAPLTWVWSYSGPARRHRRLRAAAAYAPALPPGDDVAPGVDELLVAFRCRAQRLDEELAALHRVPRGARTPALRRIDAEIAALRPLAERLADLRPPTRTPADDELEERLTALEAAHAELRAIERRARGDATDVGSGARELGPPPPPG